MTVPNVITIPAEDEIRLLRKQREILNKKQQAVEIKDKAMRDVQALQAQIAKDEQDFINDATAVGKKLELKIEDVIFDTEFLHFTPKAHNL